MLHADHPLELLEPGSPEFHAALQPGDVPLFNRTSPFNWIIRVKTWSRISHVEVVATTGAEGVSTVAARNGEGVKRYPPDWDGLALVLRPVVPVHIRVGLDWFYRERLYTQGYDWLGLLNFTYARLVGRDNAKQFCSEFATRFLRVCGVPLFEQPEHQDADTIAPRDFLLTPYLRIVWRSQDEWERYQTRLTEEHEYVEMDRQGDRVAVSEP